ncbi:hypothetical protein TNCV_2092121 [Trichonephila clavipes]|nr:hypothetical protein TNCV_2092121 [Trichonephila clavipes]
MPVHVPQLNPIGKETHRSRERVSSHQQSNVSVDGAGEAYSFVCRGVNKGTGVGLRLQKPILVDAQALKSAAI